MSIFKKLCPPAIFYVAIAIISILVYLFTAIDGYGGYKMGSKNLSLSQTILFLLFKFLYIIFWAWVINFICKQGYQGLSWFLVLLPFFVFFILISLLMYSY